MVSLARRERIMQEAVLKLKDIGAPPEGFTDHDFFPSDEILVLWDEYMDAVQAINTPVTWEEAKILIKCCPTDRMAGIEWSLLHCIESCIVKGYGAKRDRDPN